MIIKIMNGNLYLGRYSLLLKRFLAGRFYRACGY